MQFMDTITRERVRRERNIHGRKEDQSDESDPPQVPGLLLRIGA